MWVKCQSLAAPSSAEYWHIGATMTRLARLRPRRVIGENRALMLGVRERRKGCWPLCSETLPPPQAIANASLPSLLIHPSAPSTSLRAQRSNPFLDKEESWIASLRSQRRCKSSARSASRRAASEVLHLFHPPRIQRAQGKPGAGCTRSLVCKKAKEAHTSTQVQPSHPGFPRARENK